MGKAIVIVIAPGRTVGFLHIRYHHSGRHFCKDPVTVVGVQGIGLVVIGHEQVLVTVTIIIGPGTTIRIIAVRDHGTRAHGEKAISRRFTRNGERNIERDLIRVVTIDRKVSRPVPQRQPVKPDGKGDLFLPGTKTHQHLFCTQLFRPFRFIIFACQDTEAYFN